jgi:hypothetical protein
MGFIIKNSLMCLKDNFEENELKELKYALINLAVGRK